MNTNAVAAPAIDGAFLALLQKHRKGGAITEASDLLRELNEAVQLTGKAGSLSLKLTVSPATRGQGAVVVVDELKLKKPEVDRDNGSIFFVDAQNNLVREDPNQQKLDLQPMDGGKQIEEPKAVQGKAVAV